ncbi:MAG: hypothetical protein JWM11_5665 [Planctomycetaceae bacterium]|nr:hypothetical protein [Planctomycetaceae bacterium]
MQDIQSLTIRPEEGGEEIELSQTGLQVDVGLRPGWGFKSIVGPIPGHCLGCRIAARWAANTVMVFWFLFRIAQTAQLQKPAPRPLEFRLFKHALSSTLATLRGRPDANSSTFHSGILIVAEHRILKHRATEGTEWFSSEIPLCPL